MRRFTRILLGCSLALAIAGPVSAATPVVVDATAGWVSTGIDVAGGDQLSVSTKGFATTAKVPDWFIPGSFISGSGPAGQTNGALCGDYEPLADLCFVADAYFGELVGRVGDTTFLVGDAPQITIPAGASGELELAVNDYSIYLGDNHGAFTVIFW